MKKELNVSRRNFLKGMGVAALGAGASMGLAACASTDAGATDTATDGTTIHVIHALKMDPDGKYEKRYRRHFRDPDLIRFDMQHEEWLFGSAWTDTVLAAIDERMEI